LYISTLELAQIRFDRGNLVAAKALFDQYLTIKEFASLPFTPRSLWIGIQIEKARNNEEVVASYVTLLSRLYEDSPEYQLYQNLVAND
jgi:type IV pilus assembly protein PilF